MTNQIFMDLERTLVEVQQALVTIDTQLDPRSGEDALEIARAFNVIHAGLSLMTGYRWPESIQAEADQLEALTQEIAYSVAVRLMQALLTQHGETFT